MKLCFFNSILLLASCTFLSANAFVSSPQIGPSTQLLMSADDNKDENETVTDQLSKEQQEFLEKTAQDGAAAVRKMSIEERTKRAMLAEATEDRMIALVDDLDELLGEDGLPKKVEDREEAVSIAKEIKASQEQYKALVNGEPSGLLDTLDQ
ncbi:hypothetical protein CTEN210_13780 [Chaetoceros tenuissimus]|uniref:Uncharacterized protein n=1 Tax=Chaetoceros tenuissimus TaxID=426638 RepID=A0AAD3HBQ5_9STRA|nr:hypothetical protein CTEN210_13780 [Chaetoceros tenuissimus]